MEQFIAKRLMNQDVELYCVGAEKFTGTVIAVEGGVVTLEWEGKQSYIAADKVVAIWPREQGNRPTPSIGFLR